MPPGSRRRLSGLAPVIGEDARVLILGSFPSRQSLATGQYYANPKNHFWKIMEYLAGIDPALPYKDRITLLISHRIALWDAVSSCRREGSADSRITRQELNPVAELLSSHPGIRLIACNGSTSARFVQAFALPVPITIPIVRLPSTSPAHARLSFEGKIREWSIIKKYLEN